MLIPQHVEQRYLHVDGAPEFGVLDEFHSHQQPAIGPPHDAQMPGARDSLRDQVPRHGGEVVVDALPMRLETRVVPRRAELASTAYVGEYKSIAPFQPELAQ